MRLIVCFILAIRLSATRLFYKAGLFIFLKGNKNEITAKFRASRQLRFEDAKRIMSAEIHPVDGFGTLEKRALDL